MYSTVGTMQVLYLKCLITCIIVNKSYIHNNKIFRQFVEIIENRPFFFLKNGALSDVVKLFYTDFLYFDM